MKKFGWTLFTIIASCIQVCIRFHVYVVMFLLIMAGIGFVEMSLSPYAVIEEPVRIEQQNLPSANAYQWNASVKLMPVQNKLIYYIRGWSNAQDRRSRFDGSLCTIEQGKIKVITKPGDVLGTNEQVVYYYRNNRIFSYNVDNKEKTEILRLKGIDDYWIFPDSFGALHITPLYDTGTYYVIKNETLISEKKIESVEEVDIYEEYQLGKKVYRIDKSFYGNNELYCDDVDITDQLGEARYRHILPYLDGLLVINHGESELVYFIDKNGEIRSLFPEFPCMMSESSVNFYENYVFVSFKRWEGYHESGFGIAAYENDMLAGTYRIDMTDGSVEKISDNIYDGMFVFDDTGIFCTNDQGDISKIDFDGNLLISIVD